MRKKQKIQRKKFKMGYIKVSKLINKKIKKRQLRGGGE